MNPVREGRPSATFVRAGAVERRLVEGVGEGPPGAKRRRWPWVAVGFLALGAALRVAAPYGVARGIERAALAETGLPVTIANVDLGLLRGVVAADDIVVGRPGGAPSAIPLLRVRHLVGELALADLLAGGVRLREVAVEEPVLRLQRLADGSLEDPLPPRPAEEPEGAHEAAAQGPGWPLQVDRLRVTGLDLELADPGREAPALGFALEELVLEAVALTGDDLTLGGVGVRGPRLRVERSLVFPPPATAPVAPAAAGAPGEPAPPAAAGPRYRLERVAVEHAGISLLTEGKPLDLELDLTAEGVSARAGETFPFTLGLRVEGGELSAEGRAGLAPPSFDGTLRWHDLPVPLFVVAARPDLVAWVRSCRAEGELAVALRLEAGAGPEEPAGARLSGRFAVRDLALVDPEEQDIELAWRGLEVDVREAFVPLASGPAPVRVALERVRLDAPVFRYARPSPALDALLGVAPSPGAAASPAEPATGAEAAAPPPAANAGTASAPGTPLELTVAAFELSGGRIGFSDGTLAAPFRAALRDLSVSARDVRWPGPGARSLRVRGVAPESAPFTLSGSLDGARGALAFEIQGLKLPVFDPYARRAGYHVERGEASLLSSLRLEPERYVSENDLRLHDLRLDAADSGAFERQFGTRLDFTLALLRNPSGDIRLPVPLSVERESLHLGFGPLVRGALREALLGVVSSPLKMLGAALPRGGEGEVDAAALAAAPGSSALVPEESARVKALRKLLRTRPLLAVTLTGRAGPEDRAVLAEKMLRERAAAGESLPEVAGASFFASRRVAAALREGTAEALASEDAALLARMIAAAEVPPERFGALARERAATLRERLVTGKRPAEPARVAVAQDTQEGAPGVALELVARTEEVAP